MKTALPDKTHPLWLRISHWLNVVAVTVMIMSGWRIYNASPLFGFKFYKAITLGGWLGGALQWHFAAMWLLFLNGIFYLFMNVATGRGQKKFLPLRPRAIWHDLKAALKFRLKHDDLSHYNAVQKAAYLGAICALIVLVCSGLAIWKPVQFPLLRSLTGDYDNARIVHFAAMSAIVAFIIVHIAMVAAVPRTLKGMILGRF